jgi:hypothetical protein
VRLHFLTALLFVALSSVLGTARATAQDATPGAFPITPDPKECQVSPRAAEDLLALLSGTPAAASPVAGTPLPALSEEELPAGAPADAAVVDGITAAVSELIACNNAGDLARVFAFYTDDVIRLALIGDPAAGFALAFAAPTTAGAQTELVDVREVRVLDDERVGAIVESRDPQRTVVSFLVFVPAGEGWLIDERIDVQTVATPTIGTPEA